MSKTFVPLVEHNEWEGETWTFWLQVEGNEDELVKLYEWIAEFEVEAFELDVNDRESEDVVDRMVERAEIGYIYSDNKFTGRLTMPDKVESGGRLFDMLYKGGINSYFKENK